jgi:hypothetical protein
MSSINTYFSDSRPEVVYLNNVMNYTKTESREEPIQVQQENFSFIPDNFLTGLSTQLINSQNEVMPLIKETFETLTQTPFPQDIMIRICDEDELAGHYGHGYVNTIQGFCKNKVGYGITEIYVKAGEMANVMLTAGHELGHAMTTPLNDIRDEEAKAFSFSLAWMDCIRENNIGNLQTAILPRPAVNGVHNVAYNFVLSTAEQGKGMMNIFESLCNGTLTIQKPIEQIILEVNT